MKSVIELGGFVTELNDFYVYALTDPRKNNQYFYIGKGRLKRWKLHLREIKEKTANPHRWNTIAAIRALNMEPGVVFIEKDMIQSKALELEETLIKKYGRVKYDPNGILTNICLGGLGGGVGKATISLEERVKTSLSHSQRYLLRQGLISEDNIDHYFETLRSYFFTKSQGNDLNKLPDIYVVLDSVIEQRKHNMINGIKPKPRRISERFKNLSLSQAEYHTLFPRLKKPRVEPLRLKERRYILTDVNGVSHKLGSRELTKFCLDHGINRINLTANAFRKNGKAYKGWTLIYEDCDQNTNNPKRIRSPEEQKTMQKKLTGRKRTAEQRQHGSDVQQRLYLITDPDGKQYSVKSRDVKNFCKALNISPSTLMTSKQFNRVCKGWSMIQVSENSTSLRLPI